MFAQAPALSSVVVTSTVSLAMLGSCVNAGPTSPLTAEMVVGLGPDAHLASMFPDQASLSERSRLVVGVEESGL